MASRPHKNDISIGEDTWIKFGNLRNGQARAVEIDPLLAPVMSFFLSLETGCEAECCGIGAFQLWPENIENVIASFNAAERKELSLKLASVNKVIQELPTDTVVSTRLNQYFRKSVFLEILAHVLGVVEAAGKK